MDAALNNQPVPPDAVRMVGIRKVSGEHLVSLLSKENLQSVIIKAGLSLTINCKEIKHPREVEDLCFGWSICTQYNEIFLYHC